MVSIARKGLLCHERFRRPGTKTPVLVARITGLVFLLASFMPASAQQEFRFVPGGLLTAPGASDGAGLILFPAEDRYVYSINSAGDFVSRRPLTRRPGSSFAPAADGVVWLGVPEVSPRRPAQLLALNRRGAELVRLSGEVHGLVVLADQTILVARNGGVEALTHRGRLLWRLDGPARIVDTDGLRGLAVGPAGGVIVDSVGKSMRFAHARASFGALAGDSLWLASSDGRISRQSISAADRAALDMRPVTEITRFVADSMGGVLLVDGEGRLHRIDGDGRLRFSAGPSGARIHVVAAADAGGAFVGTDDGRVIAVDPAGTPRATWHTWGGAAVVQVFVPMAGLLAFSDRDWIVYGIPEAGATPAVVAPEAGMELPGLPPRVEPAWAENLDFQYLRRLAESRFVSDKQQVLDEIASAVHASELAGKLAYYRYLLRYLVAEPLVAPRLESGALRNNDVELRSAALSLLVEIALPDEGYFLSTMLSAEIDPRMRTALVEAIGLVASDPVGRLRESILLALSRSLRNPRPDAAFVEAALAAYDSLIAYSGRGPAGAWIELLQDVLSSNVPRTTRERIIAAIRAYNRP